MLMHRLADLNAATSPLDLPVGHPRPGSDNETMVLDLADEQVIVFTANHKTNPRTMTGLIDWGKVTRVKILRIGSEHAEN